MAMAADNHLQGSGVEAAISPDGVPVIYRGLNEPMSLEQSLKAHPHEERRETGLIRHETGLIRHET